MRHNDRLGELLAVCLVAAVVLDLDVQVERALAPVHLLAVLVGANVLPVDLLGRSSVMLFPTAVLVAHVVLLLFGRFLRLKR